MKKIEAFVKSICLPKVMLALHHIEGLTGMTTTEAHGFGSGHGPGDHATDDVTDMMPIVRIEMFCRDELVDAITSAVETAARTGLRGDGKIYVMPVEQAVGISTGERGCVAV